MASLASRFQRRAPDERVGEILSDSNSEIASIDGGDEDSRREKGAGAAASDSDEDRNNAHEEERDSVNQSDKPTAARVHQRPTPLQAMKRKNSKWYDSEDDDDWDHVASDGERVAPRTRGATATTAPPAPTSAASQEAQSKSEAVTSPENNQAKPKVFSPEAAGSGGATKPQAQAELGGRRSSFQRLVGKTFNLSPFGSKRKGLDVASPASSSPDTPRGGADAKAGSANPKPSTNPVSRMRSPLSDVSSVGDGTERALSNASERRPTIAAMGRKRSQENNGVVSEQTTSDVVSPQSYRNSPAATDSAAASRRRSNMVQSPNGGDEGGSTSAVARRGSDLPASAVGDALSPGQRRVPGASPGRPDSGVTLEGWLRQKQRRGVKGMKKWNWRYFVLYARTLEVRYYADVVQSAWGPIPLGEIGSISLRLIQRIGKPSNLKYKGCRLDITCRNTWGTHYADDYVSSEDENTSNNYAEGDNNARARNSTPRSSRVYSLMADSPQTTGVWFTTLDSLLIRSANSPRVDVAPSSASNRQARRNNSMAAAAGAAVATGRMNSRPRASTLDTETLVLCGPNDHVPKPVLTAINFIFDSAPGIETEKFYEAEPDPVKLKTALRLLNQYATESSRKPSKEELEQVLDPFTAGAVVKLWLSQLEQPLVPFEMYEDFRSLAADAKDSPFELSRNLKALVLALPRRNYSMLACLLFHLNDVDGYARHNAMDATALAAIFSDFIVRPRASNQDDPVAAEAERQSLRVVVSEMIAHADAIVDENNETEILERV